MEDLVVPHEVPEALLCIRLLKGPAQYHGP